jgi:hypothetical protein
VPVPPASMPPASSRPTLACIDMHVLQLYVASEICACAMNGRVARLVCKTVQANGFSSCVVSSAWLEEGYAGGMKRKNIAHTDGL